MLDTIKTADLCKPLGSGRIWPRPIEYCSFDYLVSGRTFDFAKFARAFNIPDWIATQTVYCCWPYQACFSLDWGLGWNGFGHDRFANMFTKAIWCFRWCFRFWSQGAEYRNYLPPWIGSYFDGGRTCLASKFLKFCLSKKWLIFSWLPISILELVTENLQLVNSTCRGADFIRASLKTESHLLSDVVDFSL